MQHRTLPRNKGGLGVPSTAAWAAAAIRMSLGCVPRGNTKPYPVLSFSSTFPGGTTAQLGILGIQISGPSARPSSHGVDKMPSQ